MRTNPYPALASVKDDVGHIAELRKAIMWRAIGGIQMPNSLEGLARTLDLTPTELIFTLLREGATGAGVLVVVAFLLSRFIDDIFGRSLLGIFLFSAAGAYFGFAVGAWASPIWMLVELVQVVIFGTLALRSLRGSPYWLALGWALHPVWDFMVHYIGPGHSFTPLTYAIAGVTFDWVVAAYITIVYGFGLLRQRSPAPR
jgi:hypothetical protein